VKEKKNAMIRARVDEQFARSFRKYCRARGWTEPQVIREAVIEFLDKAAAKKGGAR
jgi:hypothetical protein